MRAWLEQFENWVLAFSTMAMLDIQVTYFSMVHFRETFAYREFSPLYRAAQQGNWVVTVLVPLFWVILFYSGRRFFREKDRVMMWLLWCLTAAGFLAGTVSWIFL